MGSLGQKYRCALITGASSGLGLAFTRMLLADGVQVIGVSRSPDVKGLGADYVAIPMDLSELSELPRRLDQVFECYTEIDLVINNAGFGILEYLEGLSDKQVAKQYAVMLEAPTLIAARALRAFKARKVKGCLVNVSSLAAELPLPLMPIYNVCKAGLSALSESLLLDGSKDGAEYCVIDFRPGDFNTNFAERMEGRVDWQGDDLRTVMDRHHAKAPGVDVAVSGLRSALLCGRSGRVRVGDFFQAKIAPLGPRLLPSRVVRAIIRWYYKA